MLQIPLAVELSVLNSFSLLSDPPDPGLRFLVTTRDLDQEIFNMDALTGVRPDSQLGLKLRIVSGVQPYEDICKSKLVILNCYTVSLAIISRYSTYPSFFSTARSDTVCHTLPNDAV
jgi:hypothetical protein